MIADSISNRNKQHFNSDARGHRPLTTDHWPLFLSRLFLPLFIIFLMTWDLMADRPPETRRVLFKVKPAPAYPSLGDMDGDGDLDLVVGLQQDKILYFENVGSITQPTFVERQSIPIAPGVYHPKPLLHDIDLDGKPDLFFGTNRGTIGLYKNKGLKADRTVDWQVVKAGLDAADSFLGIRHPDLNSYVSICDIDGDGDTDIFITGTFGTIAFYENINNQQFQQRTIGDVGRSIKDINGLDINVGPGGRPLFVDVDADGDFDILAGQGRGPLVLYINKGDRRTAKFEWQSNKFLSDKDLGIATTIAVADIDSSGKLDLLVGNGKGEVIEIDDLFPAGSTRPPLAGNGLRAEYFSDAGFNRLAFTRIDPQINFTFGMGSPDPRIAADNFSVRWKGRIRIPSDDNYTFITTSDDGVRLWIDGRIIIDNFTDHAPTENGATIFLTAGDHLITLEYFEHFVWSIIRLEILSANIPRQVIPAFMLSPTDPNGLIAEYFDNNSLAGAPILTRIDPQINFTFGMGSPHPRIAADNFSVRWRGLIEIPADGIYIFSTISDDGVRLFIDDQLIIDNWIPHMPTEDRAQILLTAGKHSIELRYFEGVVSSVISLYIQSASMPRQVVPASMLFPR